MFCGITYILKVENSLMGEIAILYVSTFKQQRMIRFHCSVEVNVCILSCHPPTPPQRKSQEFAYHVEMLTWGAKESESMQFSLLYLLHSDQVQARQT